MTDIIMTEADLGCHLDNHRGHYIGRDAIQLAQGYGFIVGSFEQWAIDTYDDHGHEEGYPHEAMIELCDKAVEWLNSGQAQCVDCLGSGQDAEGWLAKDGSRRCKRCTGTGRGDRIDGQNFPPHIPNGTVWSFEDGDFGLWRIEDLSNGYDFEPSPDPNWMND